MKMPRGSRVAFVLKRGVAGQALFRVCAGVLLLLATEHSATANPQSPPVFLNAWSARVTPYSVAIGSGQVVFVTDQEHSRVNRFTREGVFLSWWGVLPGPGQLGRPVGICVGSGGRVYVVNGPVSRIEVFDETGAFLFHFGSAGSGPGQFIDPREVAADALGSIYVTSHGTHQLQQFSGDGAYLRTIGSGLLGNAVDVAVDPSGAIFVTDETGFYNRVAKFAQNGSLILTWGGPGSGPGQFNGPAGICVDLDGNVYVADHNNNRVQKFDPQGKLLTLWGTAGTGPGEFNVTLDVTVNAHGEVYVSDVGNHRIQRFGGLLTPALPASWGGVKAKYWPGASTTPKDQ